MTRVIFAMLLGLSCAVPAFGEHSSNGTAGGGDGIQLTVGYLYQGSQPTFGGSWFGVNGGSADVLVPVTEHLGAVGGFSGVHAGSLPSSGSGLTLLTYLAGPRYSQPLRRRGEANRFLPFAQALFGGVHGSEGLFPNGAAVNTTGDGFAMTAGGGLEVGVNRRFSLRAIQAEYLYTRLPNLYNNYESSFRIGAGVSLRLR